MNNERIDLAELEEQFNDGLNWDDMNTMNLIAELKRCYEELDEYDKLVGLLIENHFVETSPYETIKHLIETHQDYRASE